MKNIKKLLCVVIALISVFAFNACGKTDSNKEKEENTTYPPAKNISIETIHLDYKKNEIVAKETHIGQRYRITSYVNDISEDEVVVKELVDIAYIYVHLKYKDQKDFVRNITTDNIITFEGTLTDMNYNQLTFEDVIFVSYTTNVQN